MSALNVIKQLEAKKQKLLAKAKTECLKKVETVLRELRELGFEYELVEAPSTQTKVTKKLEPAKNKRTAKKRRSGIGEKVRRSIASQPAGMTRKAINAALKADSQTDKRAISNALSALKRNNAVTLEGGIYKAV